MPAISHYSSRKSRFLNRMKVLVPWNDIADILLPYYHSSRRGYRPFPLMLMLRIHCLQLWFDLSDSAAEDAQHDVLPFREFTDIRKYVPDRTTIMNFRYFLEKHHAGEQVLTRINDKLWSDASPWYHYRYHYIKNKSRYRDPEMHLNRKRNQQYFGMKAHIAVDAATGLTEKVVTTAANEHDLNAADRLITAPVEVVFTDAGYRGAENRNSLLDRVKYWFIAMGPNAINNFRQHPIQD